MPTELPDPTRHAQRRREELCAKLGPTIVLVLALLLAWNVVTLDAHLVAIKSTPIRHDGEYTPMELSQRSSEGPTRPIHGLAQR